MTLRPCYLVIDREYAGSISTRKLVIETAKLNVITSYSAAEALATLERFPNVDGIVMDGGIEDVPCAELAAQIKQKYPSLPIIVVASPDFAGCPTADFQLETFEPAKLLDLLKSLNPRKSAEIEKRNEELDHKG
jgi:CheY-like chemotaxis protein